MSLSIRPGRLFAAACAGMAVFGFSLALLGTLFGFPEIRQRLHVDVMRQGEISSLLIGGIWLATVFAGPLIDRFGNKPILAVSSLMVSLAFMAFGIADSFGLACAAAFFVGCGGGGLNTSTNVVVSDLYEENRGARLNILGIFVGGGAVLVPLFAARISPSAAIAFAAVVALLTGLIYLVIPFPRPKEGHSFALREAVKVVGYPGVLLFSFLLFFESANEQVMNTFTSTWIGAAGATAQAATLVLVGFQLAMASGRILAARLLSFVPKQKIIVASAIASVVATLILFCSHTATGMSIGVIVTGLSLAAVYPTVLALVGDRYRRFSGTVFGTLFTIALIGGASAPSAVGMITKLVGLHAGIAVPVLGTIMVTVLATGAIRAGNRECHPPSETHAKLTVTQQGN